MKAIRYFLTAVLIFVVIVTLYYTVDRFLINDGVRGIAPKDILHICLFLVLPLCLILFAMKKFGKKGRK